LSGASKAASVLEAEFMAAMNDDLNTPQALAALFELAKQVNIQKQPGLAVLLQKLANQLGLLEQTPEQFFKSQPSSSNLDEQAIEALIEQRSAARQAKDFARSDAIRDELLAQGIELLDSASGTTWRKI